MQRSKENCIDIFKKQRQYCVGTSDNTSTAALLLAADEEKGTQCLEDINTGPDPPGSGVERKTDGPCSVRESLLQNPKKLRHDRIRQNFIRKAMVRKVLFCR
jgi:hypothetical protein